MITREQAEELCEEEGAVTFVLYLDNGDIQSVYEGFIESVSGDRATVNSGNRFTLSVALEDIYMSDGAIIQKLVHERQNISWALSEKVEEVNSCRRQLDENFKHLQEVL
jgi:hypothetical protein